MQDKQKIKENIQEYKKNRKPVIFISGPITDDPQYKEKFKAAEEFLNNKGYAVLNPAKLPLGMEYISYMMICKSYLLEAEEVYLLKDWENSEVARLEVRLAKILNRKIINQE